MTTTSTTDREGLAESTLVDVLERVIETFPDRVAFAVDGGDDITYAELGRRVRRLAAALLERGGDGPVAVVGGNEPATWITFVGAAYAGRWAIALDARESPARLAGLARRLDALVTSTDDAALDAIATEGHTAVVTLAELERATETTTASPPEVSVRPEDPVVGFFTSGSTGEPKAVPVPHSWVTLIASIAPTTEDDRVALLLPPTFSASTVPLFGGLFHGATCCCLDLTREPMSRVPEWLDERGITTFMAAPSVLRSISAALAERGTTLPAVTYVTVGGERVAREDVEAARAAFPNGAVEIRYGSTEAGAITFDVIEPDADLEDDPLPVGRPVWWHAVDVVDDDGVPLPVGESGHVVVRGVHLAAGYVGDPDKTAQKFFIDEDGGRGLRTGDLGRLRGDGKLVVLGRSDLLVKVRGALIDPAAVEEAGRSLDGVDEIAVTAVSTPQRGTRLVAHVVAVPGVPLDAHRVRADLAALVPPAAVPATVVVTDALPRGSSGKVDRAGLRAAAADLHGPLAEYVAPATPTEALVAQAFAAALGLEGVGADDDFFELGGDSLSAVEMLASLADSIDVEIAPGTLLDASTPAALGARIDDRRATRARRSYVWHPTATGLPVWCVPGGGANILQLRLLAQGLADNPVHVLVPRGVDRRALPDVTLRGAARRYARQIEESPSGPLVVAGYSYGGMVAIELARILGDRVQLVALLDPPPIDMKFTLGHLRQLVWYGRAVRRFGDLEAQDFAINRYTRLVARLHRPRPFTGRTLFVQTEGGAARAYVDAGVVSPSTRIVTLRSKHRAMLREPTVSEIVAALTEELRALNP